MLFPMHLPLMNANYESSTSLLITLLNLLASSLEMILHEELMRLIDKKSEIFSRVLFFATRTMLVQFRRSKFALP